MGLKRSQENGMGEESSIKKMKLNDSSQELLIKKDIITKMFKEFPNDLVMRILKLLSRKDMINLSSTSSDLRAFCKNRIFKDIKVTWAQLRADYVTQELNIFKEIGVDHSSHQINNLRITDVSLKEEWAFPFNHIGDVLSLEMVCSKSTNFFKYFPGTNPDIKHLNLKSNNTSGEKECNVFNLRHLTKFRKLETLKLDNFYIEAMDEEFDEQRDSWDDDWSVYLPTLKKLTLIDCSWKYPLELKKFNFKNTLKKITLIYKKDHYMLRSERFKDLISNYNDTDYWAYESDSDSDSDSDCNPYDAFYCDCECDCEDEDEHECNCVCVCYKRRTRKKSNVERPVLKIKKVD